MNKVNDKMQKCSFCGAMASENDDNVLIQSETKIHLFVLIVLIL